VSLTEPFSERAGEGGSAAMFVHMFAAARALICFAGLYQIYTAAPAFLDRKETAERSRAEPQ